jgi:type I restriction enzyme, S subunit
MKENTLPDGWEEKTLSEVCDVRDGTHDSPKYIDKGFPLITSKNLKNGRLNFEKIKYISEADYNSINKRSKVDVGDILFAMIGTIGNPVLIKNQPNYAIKNVALFKKKSNDVLMTFFEYFLVNPIVIDKMTNEAKGATQKFVGLNYLRSFKIPLPPLEEQNRIVAKIDTLFAKIDKAISLTEESLKQAKNLLPSVLNEVFETIDGEEKFLPELVKEGRYSIKRGPFGSSLKKQFFVPSGYKVYEQKHAIRDDFEIGEYFVNEEKYLELKAFDLKPRDIIISCSGTVGRIAVAPDNLMPGIINQALLKISLNEDEIEISFFTYWFNNYVNNGSLSTKGAAIKNIVSVKELKAIPIKVPTLNSQKEICNQFDRYSQLSKQTQSKLEEQLAYLKQLKSSILSKAFKGEL